MMSDLEKKVVELRKRIQTMRKQLGPDNYKSDVTVGELMIRAGMILPDAYESTTKVSVNTLKAKLGALKK